ncbi:MAG: glycosyltransferase family 39 protein [Flavobacteriaceae bacterium]
MKKITLFIKNNTAISWILGFQLFRFILLPFMGLMPQDAYYYLYGQNLSLSYFDHPGMIGYLLRIFTEMFGQSIYVVKLADFTITSLTIIYFYKLSSLFLSKHRTNRSIVLLVSTLFISILSFNSTPDVPLLLFWTLSILFLHRAIFEDKKWYWILAGIAMGIAFNSKYTALLLQIGILGFVIFSTKYRKLLMSPWLWLSLLISIAVTFPVWLWNYQNEFASFAFQSSERTSSIGKFEIKPLLLLGAIGHQLFLLLPILFCVFVVFSFKHIKKVLVKFKLPSEKTLFLLAFFIPTFIGFFLISPVYWVKLNWMMPSYITGTIIAGMYITKKLIKAQLMIAIIFHVAVASQVLFYFIPIKSDDTWVGWRALGEKVEEISKNDPEAFIFSMDGYKTSAQLRFFTSKTVFAQNVIQEPALQFDYLEDDMEDYRGRNAFYIDSDKRNKNKEKLGKLPVKIKPYFKSYIELNPIIVNEGTSKERKFWVFYCKNYQPKK